ncbi:hypothetical protein ACHQM5_011298 [Ranunculus cassubicifolius]
MVISNSNYCVLKHQSSDKAWYNVVLVLKGEVLTVKYYNVSEAQDERFDAAKFTKPKDLEDLIKSFRFTTAPLRDCECKNVSEGTTVCASYDFGEDGVKYFDAFVTKANFKDHKYGTREKCTCTFLLVWVFGPNAGKETEAVVANICLIQSGDTLMDPTLSQFVEICKKKFKGTSQYAGSVSEVETLKRKVSTSSPQSSSHSRPTKEVKVSVSAARTSKVRSTDQSDRTNEDIDLGGKYGCMEDLASGFHGIMIENLEKHLSASTIVDFVKRNLSINSRAQVFPSLAAESYTKGIILVDSQVDVQKLSDFLDNPTRMILSSRGRPWVIGEKKFLHGDRIGSLTMLSERSPEFGDKIRVVRNGTIEYEKGTRLKNLFLEFSVHQQDLHKRLEFEESTILRSSGVPCK